MGQDTSYGIPPPGERTTDQRYTAGQASLMAAFFTKLHVATERINIQSGQGVWPEVRKNNPTTANTRNVVRSNFYLFTFYTLLHLLMK